MKAAGYLVGACLALAVMKALATALALGVVLAIIVGAFTRPRETFGMLAFVMLANLVEKSPGAFVALVVLLLCIPILADKGR